MAEWLKAHAWKACIPQGIQGSNPCLSAILHWNKSLAKRWNRGVAAADLFPYSVVTLHGVLTVKSLHKFAPAMLLMAWLTVSGCGSGYHLENVTVPASIALYSIDATAGTVLQFASDGKGSATQQSTLALPSGFSANLLATDSVGRLYVGGYTTNVNTTEVLVYAAGSAGTTAPLRTVLLETGKLTALAADSSGQIYAGQLNVAGSVKIYSASANGSSSAVRSIVPASLQANLLYIDDLAVDSAGNTYVSIFNGGAYLIVEYPATATGSATATRTLIAPANSYFGGIAVDNAGNVFAMEQLTIVQFAPGTTGTPVPTASINLPAPVSPYTAEAYPDVLRRDTAGNFYVPVTESHPSTTGGATTVTLIYGFAPTASGNANPILQFTAKDATLSTPLGTHIPLGVF